jgi:hypothetical protein
LEISEKVVLLSFKVFKVKKGEKGVISSKGEFKGSKIKVILV